MPKIKQDIFERILERQNDDKNILLDVIKEHTQLRREGVSFKGECPCCHANAMVVTPGKGFYCHSCNTFKGVTAYHYLTQGLGKTTTEAVEELAHHLNIFVEYEEYERPIQTKTKDSDQFCRRMLKSSGLTRQDVTAKVYANPEDSDPRDFETFQSGTMTPKGDLVAGDDAVIYYYDLEGRPVTYTPESDKEGRPRQYYRVRYQFPEMHKDKKEGKPMKYRTPYGAPAFIYYPQAIRKAYQAQTSIETLFVQEGEKKAEKATKHGIPSVAVSGIQNIAQKGKLPEDLVKLIEVCKVKEVIFLLDSDCMDLSHELRVDVPIEKRPKNFFYAVRNFRDYFNALARSQRLYVEILFGYVLKNEANDKGIDDLLANTLKKDPDALAKDIADARNRKPMTGSYVQLYKISTYSDNKLMELWHLQAPKDFALQYIEQLKDLPEFTFGGRRYRFNDAGEFESAQPIEVDEKFWTDVKRKDETLDAAFDYDGAKNFLEHRGYWRHEKPNHEYEFVHVDGQIVSEVKPHQIADFIKQFAQDTLPKYVRNMLHRGATQYFGPVSLSMLGYFTEPFDRPAYGTERLFFRNTIWEITADHIKSIPYTSLGFYIWGIQRKDFEVTELPELIRIHEEDGIWSYTITPEGQKCDFLRFLENTSNFTWRKAPNEVTEQDRRENAQHLVSKLSALGYLVATGKSKSISKAVIGMDGKQSEVGVSNGRSGKSLLGDAVRQVVDSVYKNGKEFTGGKFSPFVWDGVNERTRFVFLDDAQKDFDFESLFALITGDWPVNPKGEKGFTIPWSRSPKIYISTNHAAVGDGASFEDRQWLIAFSDFYNTTHKPIHDFGTHFFSDEWSSEQWNSFWNLVATCLRIFFRFGFVCAPGDRLEKRKLLQDVGEEFVQWADEYYSPATEAGKVSKLNQVDIPRKVIYDNFLEYIGPARRTFYNPRNFKAKLLKYCDLRGYIFNPQIFDPVRKVYIGKPNDDGVPSKDIKRNGTEYFTVGNENYYQSEPQIFNEATDSDGSTPSYIPSFSVDTDDIPD